MRCEKSASFVTITSPFCQIVVSDVFGPRSVTWKRGRVGAKMILLGIFSSKIIPSNDLLQREMVLHQLGGKPYAGKDILSSQRRILFEDIINRVPGGEKLENRLCSNTSTKNSRQPVANIRLDDNSVHDCMISKMSEGARR